VLETRFDNPVGGNVLDIDNTFQSETAEIRWGQSGLSLESASGYDFDPRDTPFSEPQDTVFPLGEFTHLNFPISLGTSISSVELFVRATLEVDSNGDVIDLGESIFEFAIMHDETPNNADPCPHGDAEDNANGCADQVIIETMSSSDTFTINGEEGTLTILGFSETLEDAENGIFSSEFISPENGENIRILSAAFTAVDAPQVPTPAPLLLVAAGLLGLFSTRGLGRRG
jgi:hypothetical protein